ncbi:MAG: ATP-binding cassette domain-containing protein [Streptosporangiales bacterium]|nr:ATP-binding cassette domain-containing protein [Streptosporangiales bacterium]
MPMTVTTVGALAGEALTLHYGREPVVQQASVALYPGAVTALVGPNGSGKSTLLRALARLHKVADGRVLLDDETVAHWSAKDFARRVTLLAQARPVPGGVSVADVVGYGRHPHRKRFGGDDPEGRDAISWAMSVTGVEAMADRGVDELSGGERQRVWLATALAQRTDVLLLDEPTTYLDLRYQIEVLDLIRDLADDHGVAVGVVLHDLNQAAAVADQVVLLGTGEVVASGRPVEVLTPDRLGPVYGIDVDVRTDAATGQLSCQPIGRLNARRLAV